MSNSTSMGLQESQRELLSEFPASSSEIANALSISPSSVRDRISRLRERGVDISYDGSEGVYRLAEEEPQRTKSYRRADAKKKINNELAEIEKEIKEVVNSTSPVVSEINRAEGGSTLVIPYSDIHIGAEIDARGNNGPYSPEIAVERTNELTDRAIHRARERGDVDHVEAVFMGDIIDGEDIYPSHNIELKLNLRQQLKKASSACLEQIEKLSEEFPTVGVRCIAGNHGRLDHKSTSNADGILYDFLEVSISNLGLENINFQKSTNGNFINFPIRDYDAHARHGENSLEHVGTSSGKQRWQNWYMQNEGFDVGFRGHYHEFKIEPIGEGIPIFETGSPTPPSLFAESLGETGRPCGVYFFATDEQVDEEVKPVYY